MKVLVDFLKDLLVLLDVRLDQSLAEISIDALKILCHFIAHVKRLTEIVNDPLHLQDIVIRLLNVLLFNGDNRHIAEFDGSVIEHERQLCRGSRQNLAVKKLITVSGSEAIMLFSLSAFPEVSESSASPAI